VPVGHLAEARALVAVGRPVERLPAQVGEDLARTLRLGDGAAALRPQEGLRGGVKNMLLGVDELVLEAIDARVVVLGCRVRRRLRVTGIAERTNLPMALPPA
jgi:hypothetical protein